MQFQVRFRSIGLFVLTIPAFAGAATPWRKDPMHRTDVIAIGELAARTGVAVSAIRFYEAKGLIASLRSSGGQRRFLRADIRRVSFILIAQQLGLSLEEIALELARLPATRTPNRSEERRVGTEVARPGSVRWAPVH